MTKRKFLLLFGCLLILMISYAGWCARMFFIHPPIVRGSDIPDKAWDAIQNHFAGKGFPPSRFSWQRFGHLLMHPYESAPTPAASKRIGTVEALVWHEYRMFWFKSETGYRWQYEAFTYFPVEIKP